MQVSQAKLINLLVELGVDTAVQWDAPTLATKLNHKDGIGRYEDPPGSFRGSHKKLYHSIVEAQARGESIGIIHDVPPPEPKVDVAAKTTKKRKKTKTTRGVDKPRGYRPPTYKEIIKFREKNPLIPTGRNVGIMRVIIQELKFAGKGNDPPGITKRDLLEILKATFPNRDGRKMWVNINNVVPSRLKKFYGIHVWTKRLSGRGAEKTYYIVGDGKTPQPPAR